MDLVSSKAKKQSNNNSIDKENTDGQSSSS